MAVRGRPKGPSKGAWQAICSARRHLRTNGISQNAWALAHGYTPSSVSRALAQSEGNARWTPTLRGIYRIAINPEAATSERSATAALLNTPSPQGEVVRRILRDLQELVELSKAAKKGR